eukprot:TRINITY_DN2643_c0_g1_i1.p1 TRINITY_DN2643_c0_g1~~TRINITY_DN2643_c0_g1_i1.p1  ORF type:complete len:767 (-),score=111.00 TRINITY_DN2643_c0_g1_i1:14-2314(-)
MNLSVEILHALLIQECSERGTLEANEASRRLNLTDLLRFQLSVRERLAMTQQKEVAVRAKIEATEATHWALGQWCHVEGRDRLAVRSEQAKAFSELLAKVLPMKWGIAAATMLDRHYALQRELLKESAAFFTHLAQQWIPVYIEQAFDGLPLIVAQASCEAIQQWWRAVRVRRRFREARQQLAATASVLLQKHFEIAHSITIGEWEARQEIEAEGEASLAWISHVVEERLASEVAWFLLNRSVSERTEIEREATKALLAIIGPEIAAREQLLRANISNSELGASDALCAYERNCRETATAAGEVRSKLADVVSVEHLDRGVLIHDEMLRRIALVGWLGRGEQQVERQTLQFAEQRMRDAVVNEEHAAFGDIESQHMQLEEEVFWGLVEGFLEAEILARRQITNSELSFRNLHVRALDRWILELSEKEVRHGILRAEATVFATMEELALSEKHQLRRALAEEETTARAVVMSAEVEHLMEIWQHACEEKRVRAVWCLVRDEMESRDAVSRTFLMSFKDLERRKQQARRCVLATQQEAAARFLLEQTQLSVWRQLRTLEAEASESLHAFIAAPPQEEPLARSVSIPDVRPLPQPEAAPLTVSESGPCEPDCSLQNKVRGPLGPLRLKYQLAQSPTQETSLQEKPRTMPLGKLRPPPKRNFSPTKAAGNGKVVVRHQDLAALCQAILKDLADCEPLDDFKPKSKAAPPHLPALKEVPPPKDSRTSSRTRSKSTSRNGPRPRTTPASECAASGPQRLPPLVEQAVSQISV